MNKIVSITATLLFAGSAFAVTATPQTEASMVQPKESTVMSAPAAAVGLTPKNIKVNYTAETTSAASPTNKGNLEGAFQSLQHVGVQYKLDADKAVQLRQYFIYERAGDKQDLWGLEDTVLRYTDSKQMTVGAATISGDTRLYIPGSIISREVGRYAIRHDAELAQVFGKAKIAYGLSGRLATYTGDSDAQWGARLTPNVTFEYAVNKVFTPYVLAYTDHKWYHTGAGAQLDGYTRLGKDKNVANNSDKFLTDIGAQFAVNKNISINAYVETEDNLRDNQAYDLLDANNNTYEIDLSISM